MKCVVHKLARTKLILNNSPKICDTRSAIHVDASDIFSIEAF